MNHSSYEEWAEQVVTQMGDGLSGLDDMTRTQRVATKFVAMVELFTAALCIGKIDARAEPIIDTHADRIGRMVGVDYQQTKAEALKKCEAIASNQAAAKATPAPAKATSGAALVKHEPLATTFVLDYEQAIRRYALDIMAQEAEQNAETAAKSVTEATTVPEDWQGTAAEFKATISQSYLEKKRQERDDDRKMATRLRNDQDLTADDQKWLNNLIDTLRSASGGELNQAQRDRRLTELLQRAFEEERTNEDFYPTPRDIIEKYVVPKLASVKAGTTRRPLILEPSAGKGDIADAVRDAEPIFIVETVEINSIRREILHHKGYAVIGDDFMKLGVDSKDSKGNVKLSAEFQNRYDAIVMNPPFAQGVGMQHIRRAVEMLKPGGTLVAIAPESYGFGTSMNVTAFQNTLNRRGAWSAELIRADEYNKEHERKILINISIITFTKSLDTRSSEDIRQGAEADTNEIKNKWSKDKVEIPTDAGEIDTDFVPPQIVTARQALVKAPTIDVIPDSVKANTKIMSHVHFGVNKAVEALDEKGGFLLADGTGTGKTLQSLLVARHYWATTGKPVIIFTVDDRVIQGSFFGDAQKLGYPTPDFIDTKTTEAPRKPKDYKGLYDNTSEKVPNVYFYRAGEVPRNGINVCTYTGLSLMKGFDAEQKAVDAAIAQTQLAKQRLQRDVDEVDERLDNKWGRKGNRRKAAKGEQTYTEERESYLIPLKEKWLVEDPSWRELVEAKAALKEAYASRVREFVADTCLVIFDEAHKIKNAGDGIDSKSATGRARLGLEIISAAARIMYVTATPADRPFDILYLKRLGFWRDEKEFGDTMQAIGFTWQEAKTNKAGQVVREASWKAPAKQDPLSYARANNEMARLFQWATEDGTMLRREIELTNLTVRYHKFQAPQSALEIMDEIIEAYTEEINGAQVVDYMAAFSVQLQELERYKMEKAYELIDAAVQKGKQCVVFVQTTKVGEEDRKATGRPKPGSVEDMKRTLDQRYGEGRVGVIIGTENEYEEFKRLENVARFQSGEMRVIIGTITSGGTGINLDDNSGRNPRELIIVTSPLSFINVVQGIGRVVRANTKSRSVAHFITAENVEVDQWLARIMATKFSTLAATVEGESNRLDPSQQEASQEGSESDSASLIAQGSAKVATGEDKVRRHPLYVKTNRRHEGWKMPNKVPLWVEVSGTPKNTLVSIGGQTRADLAAFEESHKELINKLDLIANPDENHRRFRGSYYGRIITNRDSPTFVETVEQLLNVIDYRVASIVNIDAKPFVVGEKVVTTEAIDFAGLAMGTTVTITNVRPGVGAGAPPRYDIKAEGRGEYRNVAAYLLKSNSAPAAKTNKELVEGAVFYYSTYSEMRRRCTIVSVGDYEFTVKAEQWYDVRPYYARYGQRIATKADPDITESTFDVIDFDYMVGSAFQERPTDKYGRGGWWTRTNEDGSEYKGADEEPAYSRVGDCNVEGWP